MGDKKKIIDGYALARAILEAGREAHDSMTMMVAGFVSGFIDDEPEAVVMCKNCKYAKQSEVFREDFKECTLTGKIERNNWFCADGEKRTD